MTSRQEEWDPAVQSVPVVVELDPVPDVVVSLNAFTELDDVVLLESRIDREEVSRYSFLVADPVEFVTHECAEFGVDPFARLRVLLRECEARPVPGLPPFQGGVMGVLGYELGAAWEATPRSPEDEFALPALAAGLYDAVVAWDHVLGRAWVISQGFPETDPDRRWQRAKRRAAEWVARLSAVGQSESAAGVVSPTVLERSDLSPLWPVAGHDGLYSDFSRESYLESVGRVDTCRRNFPGQPVTATHRYSTRPRTRALQAIEAIESGPICGVHVSRRLANCECIARAICFVTGR